MKNAFQLVSVVVIAQLGIVLFVLAGCFTLSVLGKPMKDDRCDGQQAGDLLSFIAAQSFALLAADKATRPRS